MAYQPPLTANRQLYAPKLLKLGIICAAAWEHQRALLHALRFSLCISAHATARLGAHRPLCPNRHVHAHAT